MIHVDRDRRDEEGRRIQPTDDWSARAELATQAALGEAQDHLADKSVYAHDEVRAVLEKLFADKCAYCETTVTAGSDWDVEHFRPKGRVAERPDHPGYYWLAYAWQNLYLSCQHCNELRKDKPRWDDPDMGPALGKVDRFPLADERTRAMSPDDDTDRETRLLLDPCADDPEPCLGYDPMGDILARDDNPKGRATIEVFHLRRRRLRDARREIIALTIAVLAAVRRLHDRGDAEAVAEFEVFLGERVTGANCEYAGAARFVRRHPDLFGIQP
jgi:uncharacterized protein (TIGR02646 family)